MCIHRDSGITKRARKRYDVKETRIKRRIKRERESGEGSDEMARYSWYTIREVSMVSICAYVCARVCVCVRERAFLVRGAFARNGRARSLACLLNED